MVKQISVFLENSKGRLANMTRLLAQAGVNLYAISIADTTEYGILRAVVEDPEKAVLVLREGGYTANLTSILAVSIPVEVPGGLADVLEILHGAQIGLEYIYSTNRTVAGKAAILCKVDDEAKAAQVLREAGIQLLDQQELVQL